MRDRGGQAHRRVGPLCSADPADISLAPACLLVRVRRTLETPVLLTLSSSPLRTPRLMLWHFGEPGIM